MVILETLGVETMVMCKEDEVIQSDTERHSPYEFETHRSPSSPVGIDALPTSLIPRTIVKR